MKKLLYLLLLVALPGYIWGTPKGDSLIIEPDVLVDIAFPGSVFINGTTPRNIYSLAYSSPRASFGIRVSLSCFFNKHWGLQLYYYNSFNHLNSKSVQNNVNKELQDCYKYYYIKMTEQEDGKHYFQNAGMALLYRISWERWDLIPKLSLLNVTSVSVTPSKSFLKSMGSNNLYQVYYTAGEERNRRAYHDLCPLGIGCYAAYKWKHIRLSLEVNYFQYFQQLKVWKTIEDAYDGKEISCVKSILHHYPAMIDFSIGTTFFFSVKKKK